MYESIDRYIFPELNTNRFVFNIIDLVSAFFKIFSISTFWGEYLTKFKLKLIKSIFISLKYSSFSPVYSIVGFIPCSVNILIYSGSVLSSVTSIKKFAIFSFKDDKIWTFLIFLEFFIKRLNFYK